MATLAKDRQQIDSSISYDFNYVEPPPDRLTCKICQLPCREAQKSECCGHVFCKRDLKKMKAATTVSYACPMCRIDPFKTYPDRAVDREIKGLRIYCRNKEVGCGCNWSGTLDQIDAHLNKCEVACEHCKEVMHYTAMISHVNECPCHCQYCGVVAERDVISGQHTEKCNKFPVPCPNTCGRDNIPQDEMDSHKKECPLEMVWCEYYDVGCKTMLVRENVSAHYRDEMARHLQYMHRVVRELQKGKENLDNAEVVAEANLHENAEQIKELLNNHTHQQETIAKLREDIVAINEKYHKVKYSACSVMTILVSVLVLAFAVFITHYDDKFTIVTEQLHNLSTTDDRNQLHNDKLINLLQESVKLHDNQLEQVVEAMVESSANMETLKHYLISVLHHAVSGLRPSAILVDTKFDILSQLSETVLLVRPVFKISDYKEKIKKKENWTSSPFFAFDGGYQMCLKLYPAGIGQGAGDHVSVELYLMKGPHDEKLQQSGHWPLRGNFSVDLLNQQLIGSPDPHITHNILISDIKNNYRVTHNGMVKIDNLSIDQFVSHEDLTVPYFFSKYVNSSVNGNLYLRVQYIEEGQALYRDISTLSARLNIHKLSLQHAVKSLTLNHSSREVDDQVAPVILKLSEFSKMMISGDPWYSSPFFAFGRGYQMCLKVVKVKDCLISLQLFVMKGPYDKELEKLGMWPLRGTFTVKLLGNKKYYPRTVMLDEERCTKCFKRVIKSDIASDGFGFSIFTLDSSCMKSNFFKGDAIFFEVMYTVM